MRAFAVAAAILVSLVLIAPAQTLPDIISRVSEEAAIFHHVAPQVLAEETLTQRAVKPSRFHPRLGAAAAKPTAPDQQTREIISEYSFGALKEAPESLHEFRQVISVDGRKVSDQAAARHSLALGLTAESDHARKRYGTNQFPVRQALGHNPRLVLDAPGPPSAGAREHLDPPNRLRDSSMLSVHF